MPRKTNAPELKKVGDLVIVSINCWFILDQFVVRESFKNLQIC